MVDPKVIYLLLLLICLKCLSLHENIICWSDPEQKTRKCRHLCEKGYFSLPGFKNCQPWMECDAISKSVKIIRQIGQGAVKNVYLADWNGYNVVVNVPRTELHLRDFRHGLNLLKSLVPRSDIIQLIGDCQDMYITEYHPLGSAEEYMSIINRINIQPYITASVRFQFCIDYVMVLSYLHSGNALSTEKLVMCDSNDLNKTLQQYLIREDLRLILNDVDSVAVLNNSSPLIKCGHRELDGDFVAPEQLWPYADNEFSDKDMPPYDEKSDIWKIPDVCSYFLSNESDLFKLKLNLISIHTKCKEINPSDRPSAFDVLQEYLNLNEKFFKPDRNDRNKVKLEL